MKSQKAFWTTILLLAALGLGGCMHEVTQQRGAGTGQASAQEPEERSSGD